MERGGKEGQVNRGIYIEIIMYTTCTGLCNGTMDNYNNITIKYWHCLITRQYNNSPTVQHSCDSWYRCEKTVQFWHRPVIFYITNSSVLWWTEYIVVAEYGCTIRGKNRNVYWKTPPNKQLQPPPKKLYYNNNTTHCSGSSRINHTPDSLFPEEPLNAPIIHPSSLPASLFSTSTLSALPC